MKFIAPLLLLVSLLACATPEPPRPAQVTDLIVFDHKVGSGAVAMSGQNVSVHYTGWLYDPAQAGSKGKKFDSSLERNQAFVFPLGAARVIKGWDQGVAGMQPGGKRTLIIPPQMAYGERNVGNGLIPPNSTLLFEVELLELLPIEIKAVPQKQ